MDLEQTLGQVNGWFGGKFSDKYTSDFANALKAALREDPDIILVGEMRDLETIQLAMTAAETGHLVFGTLHTNNAAKTVDRIIDVFPDSQQAQIRVMLAESLRGVVAQNLFKREDVPGRCAAIEILVNNSAISNLIREGKTFQIPSAMQTGMQHGMITFDRAMNQLVKEGKVSQDTADTFLGRKKTEGSSNSESDKPKQAIKKAKSPLRPPMGSAAKMQAATQKKPIQNNAPKKMTQPGSVVNPATSGKSVAETQEGIKVTGDPNYIDDTPTVSEGDIKFYGTTSDGSDAMKETASNMLKNFGFGKKKSG